MQEAMQNENFASRLVFSNEATFYLRGKVIRHNVRNGVRFFVEMCNT